MKRQICLVILLIWITTYVGAQVPAIDGTEFFQLNHRYPYKGKVDPSIQLVSEGSSGPNVVWNFNALNFNNDMLFIDTTLCIPAAGTPKFLTSGISGSDTADICLVNKSEMTARNDDYHYYKFRSNEVVETGSDQDNGLSEDVDFQCSRPRFFYLLPFTYQSAGADSFRATYFSYLSGPHYQWGYDSLRSDGYGTVLIDGKTFTSCIRLKRTSVSVDSNAILGKYSSRHIIYTWFQEGKDGPLLIVDRCFDTNANFPEPYIAQVTYYFPPPGTGIDEQGAVAPQVFIYPVPCSHTVTIRFSHADQKKRLWILYDISGKILMKESLSKATNTINTSALATGTYFYKLTGGTEILKTGSIVKE